MDLIFVKIVAAEIFNCALIVAEHLERAELHADLGFLSNPHSDPFLVLA